MTLALTLLTKQEEMPIGEMDNYVSWYAKCYIFYSKLRHLQISWCLKIVHTTNGYEMIEIEHILTYRTASANLTYQTASVNLT